MFRRDPCKKKGHDWQLYGWSVMGFSPIRYHYKCSQCSDVIDGPEPEVKKEDEPRSD